MSEKPVADEHGDQHGQQAKVQSDDPPVVFFEVLSQGRKEVLINHNSQVYRLRLTSNGKLILNK